MDQTQSQTPTPPRFRRLGMLRLSWPLLVVTVVTLLGALGNQVLLSAASAELNAAAASANQLLGVLYDISVLFSLGGLVVVSQLLGAGAMVGAQRAALVVLRASAALGLVVMALAALVGPIVLGIINTPAEIIGDARTYLWVTAVGMAFNAYIVAAVAVLRAYGRTVAILVLGIVVNVLDVALLYVFLLVLDLGVVGAALPQLLVRGVGMLLLARMIRRSTGVGLLSKLPVPEPHERTGRWQIARLSIPTVAENATYNLVIVAALSWVNLLGTDAINGRAYALTLTALVTGVVLALAQGNETIVGWDVGEESRRHAKRLTLRTAAWAAGVAALLTLLLWAAADGVLAIFQANETTVALAKQALLISALLLPASAVTAVVYGALRSTGDVVRPMIYSIATSVGVLLPLSWLLIEVAGLGVAGAFWALVVAEVVKAGLLLRRWLRGRWMAIPSVAEGEPEQVGEPQPDPA